MNFNPIGDIASNLMMRRHGNRLRQEISVSMQELASGKTYNLAKKLRGNLSTVSAVDRSINLHAGYTTSRNFVSQVLDVSQTALGTMQSLIDDIGPPLLGAVATGSEVEIVPLVARGSEVLSELVELTNTQYADRYVFSGNKFTSKSVANVDDMMTNISAAISNLTSAHDVTSALDDWFNNIGDGYQRVGYMGGEAVNRAIDISDSQSVALDITANDKVFRDTFKHAATLSLIEGGLFSETKAERDILLNIAANGLIDSSKNLIASQAKLGSMQKRVDDAEVQTSLQLQLLKSIKNDIEAADPFDVATKLEAAQAQLESLYLVTARISRLNLSEYLR